MHNMQTIISKTQRTLESSVPTIIHSQRVGYYIETENESEIEYVCHTKLSPPLPKKAKEGKSKA